MPRWRRREEGLLEILLHAHIVVKEQEPLDALECGQIRKVEAQQIEGMRVLGV